ncbi:hypothetical protein GCM10009868_18230 [Terrabacter aerolatus]|uniref:Glycosyltransferase subfamily 4-like N-terminal domain-containing protein n=1 Tax=Terrabacter aerolatus TaxID=422442 RepID=A0A512CZQ5_9MICO|nr:glycosyltransferase family 4 protein [Terrabacter aerolatus]GEO29694.1 hypothetical protein TAE01_15040 [Terrabacter aerolatus]
MKLKPVVALYAPVNVIGGIATWARLVIEVLGEDFTFVVVDTAQHYMDLGQTSFSRRLIFGTRDAATRIFETLNLVSRKTRPNVAYIAAAPSLGFWVRDMLLIHVLASFRVPIIVHLHGGDTVGFFGRGRVSRWYARLSLSRASKVVSITPDIYAELVDVLGDERSAYIPNMLATTDVAVRRPAPSRKDGCRSMVVHVGWQSIAKGSLDVVEVARLMPHFDFVLVGGVPVDFAGRLDRAVGDVDNVLIAGPMTPTDLDRLYELADVLLFPSISEGFPMVVLEAMSHGLPVVATDVGAIREMIGANSADAAGLVVSRDDSTFIQSLVKAVERAVLDESFASAARASGPQRVARLYSVESVMPRLRRVIKDLC